MNAPAPPRRTRIWWRPGWRIVPSRFPPVGVFDAIADPADIDALHEVESMTNPRMREELGAIELVPSRRRVSGPGTTPIMAAFTHLNPEGSRFTPGWYGVYYCAREQQTAVLETVFHRERFLRSTAERACVLDMRCYIGEIDSRLHDIRGAYPELHDPDSYIASQRFAVELRADGGNGIVCGGNARNVLNGNVMRNNGAFGYGWWQGIGFSGVLENCSEANSTYSGNGLGDKGEMSD